MQSENSLPLPERLNVSTQRVQSASAAPGSAILFDPIRSPVGRRLVAKDKIDAAGGSSRAGSTALKCHAPGRLDHTVQRHSWLTLKPHWSWAWKPALTRTKQHRQCTTTHTGSATAPALRPSVSRPIPERKHRGLNIPLPFGACLHSDSSTSKAAAATSTGRFNGIW